MSIVDGYELVQMVGDPDDHRPATHWAPLADPGDAHGRVDDLVAVVDGVLRTGATVSVPSVTVTPRAPVPPMG
jgi:hypothetical protein